MLPLMLAISASLLPNKRHFFSLNASFIAMTQKLLCLQSLDLKQVVNTNKCLVHIDAFDNKLLVTSCIDNLLKGAVGQAVQNMNLMFGIDETAGLRLKASVF